MPITKIGQSAMSQSYFAFLAIKNELACASAYTIDAATNISSEGSHTFYRKIANPENVPLIEEYVPVNFIPEEVVASIAAWEKSHLIQMSSLDRMDVDAVSVSPNVFEPARNLSDFAPPKRFHRTFWRSITRRLLLLSDTRME